jgi:hypothetical protein
MKSFTTSVIVSFDYNEPKDNAVLIVGRRLFNGETQIINSYQGQEAKDLWNKLVTQKKKEES